MIIVKYGPGGFFDEIETVASIDTEIDDQILEATDGSPGDGFTYGFFVTAITEDNNNRPSTILLEVEQSNNWPQQGNAADAYRDTSFLVLKATCTTSMPLLRSRRPAAGQYVRQERDQGQQASQRLNALWLV